jgi:CxxC-x17-CxxC domain-containing protein
MAFDSSQGGFRPPRQTFDVSALGLKCASCGADILELPFEPKSDRPVYCRECKRASAPAPRSGGFGGGSARQLIDVSAMGLKCADCGVAITELPFEPKSDRPVYCRTCNKARRESGGSRY